MLIPSHLAPSSLGDSLIFIFRVNLERRRRKAFQLLEAQQYEDAGLILDDLVGQTAALSGRLEGRGRQPKTTVPKLINDRSREKDCQTLLT